MFGDHLREVFGRDDDTGADGRIHTETTPPGRPLPLTCACGFETADVGEFDDHLLIVITPADSIGSDGDRHVLVDPSTPPSRWYIPDTGDD